MTLARTTIAVVGAGPAGLCAAVTCAERGADVVLIDDNAATGGQIWRGTDAGPARVLRERAAKSGVRFEGGATVVGATSGRGIELWCEQRGRSLRVIASGVVLATGARELLLPFDGWTTPGVLGAGGLQAMIKGGFCVRERRVVVAGSGPLLLAAAALAREGGAEVVALVEQAPLWRQARAAGALLRSPAKLGQAIELAQQLRGVPRFDGWWPRRVNASRGAVGALVVTDGRREKEIPCDLVGAGFGLVPNTQVATMLGCRVSPDGVRVDGEQRTTVAGVWCAGEAAGIGGLDVALAEGEIAAMSALGARAGDAAFEERARGRRFLAAMAETFALRNELRRMAGEDEVLCRCEDVRIGAVARCDGWRDAKLQRRCGMGACQGRTCGGAAGFLFGWLNDDVRPPVLPVTISALLELLSGVRDDVEVPEDHA